jgi:hypothetical protein
MRAHQPSTAAFVHDGILARADCEVASEGFRRLMLPSLLVRFLCTAVCAGLLVLLASPADAQQLRAFQYEGHIENAAFGLLEALGLNLGDPVQFTLIVKRIKSTTANTSVVQYNDAVISSSVTIGSFTMEGGRGFVTLTNGPTFDQFFAISYWSGPPIPWQGTFIIPTDVFIQMEDDTATALRDLSLEKAPDPAEFNFQRLQLGWERLDNPTTGVAIVIHLDRAKTTGRVK